MLTRQKRGLILGTAIFAGLVFFSLIDAGTIPTDAQICEQTKDASHENCATYNIALVVVWHVTKFLDDHNGLVTAVATIFIAGFTWRLWWSTHALVRGAEKTAEQQLRAYVAMESVFFAVGEMDPLFAETFRFAGRVFTTNNLKIRPKNYGSTPAFDTSIYCCARTARPANFAINAALFGRQMLHPGMEQSHHVPSPKHTEEFSVWGHIVYRDIHNRWWRTNFFYAHQKESVFIPETEYNEEKGPYKTEAEALSQ